MKQDVKEKWVAALRSGNYKQGRTRLKNKSGGFCCLGVLCDLYRQEVGGEWDGEYFRPGARMRTSRTLLPPAVQKWAGFSGPSAEVGLRRGTDTLHVHNDNGCKFTTIADAIEAQL